MYAFGIFGLVTPLISVILIIAAVRVIILTIRIPAGVSREPACEVCRYRVAGLNTLTCPECGTDLRATGIITLPMEVRRRGSLFAAIISWLFLMLLLGGLGVSMLEFWQFRPMRSAIGSGSTITTTPLTPASGAYTRLDTATRISFGTGMPSSLADYALLLNDGSTWRLTFAPLAAGYTIIDPTGAATSISPDDGKAADTFFTAAGLDPADPKINAESRELSTIIGVLTSSPFTQVSAIRLRAFTAGSPTVTSTAVSSTQQDMTVFVIVLLVGGFLWIILLVMGIIFIVSRRRKLVKLHAIPAPSAPVQPVPAP